jgi:hypothetical protein
MPAAAEQISSPYDPEARYSTKREISWVGYKVHLTETCDPETPHVITNVETTLATTPDDNMVAVVRGEGFSLPLAEAVVLGKPVITTAYGGQSDFCTNATSWLCDYSFAYTSTHLGVFDSVWVEPEPTSLAQVLREVFLATPVERARKVEAAQTAVLSDYPWDCVAQRTQAAIARVRHPLKPEDLHLPVIGVISTWNSRCGIADYARSLVGGIEPERLRVFADKVSEVVSPDEGFVRRCWVQSWDDSLEDLFEEIRDANIDAAIIQFNFGFYRLAALEWLIERLRDHGILVFITLHSTMDVDKPDITIRLGEIQPALVRVPGCSCIPRMTSTTSKRSVWSIT